MVMPNGLSGGDLAKKLRKENVSLNVIYMSGYSPEINENEDLLNEAHNFLPKPFSQGKLLNIVDFAIDPARRGK